MPDSLQSPVVLDAGDLKQLGLDQFIANLPGFQNVTGDPLDLILEAVAQMMSYGLAQYGDPTTAIASYVGSVIYNTPPFQAVSATATSTWVTDGTAGTIAAGTYVSILDATGTPVEFQVAADHVVTLGTTTTTGVTLIASEPGIGGNTLSGSATILDRLAFAVSATITAPSSGGVDAETTDAYKTRISQLAQLIAPRLILPQDFANAARLLVPSVARALAIDEYDADTSTSGVERCVTVAIIDAAGATLSSGVKDAVRAEFVARREQSFLSFVIDPTYTTINATFAAVAFPGYDTTSVENAGIQALNDLASPALHGIPASGDSTQWIDRPKVRYQDAVTALNNVVGLDYYTSLTLNGGTADVTLTGPAGLPTPGTITGAVTAP